MEFRDLLGSQKALNRYYQNNLLKNTNSGQESDSWTTGIFKNRKTNFEKAYPLLKSI